MHNSLSPDSEPKPRVEDKLPNFGAVDDGEEVRVEDEVVGVSWLILDADEDDAGLPDSLFREEDL